MSASRFGPPAFARQVLAYLRHYRALGRRYRGVEHVLSQIGRYLAQNSAVDLDGVLYENWRRSRASLHSNSRRKAATQGRRIHPHALRHATAVHLLKSGVEFATISQLLGHASVTTTMRYARAYPDLKRQALSQVFPDALGVPAAGRVRWHGAELTRWLRRP